MVPCCPGEPEDVIPASSMFNYGEIRDREKVMRGLKKVDTPILQGMQIFHNYVRPHEALKGLTPADACGIEVIGDNKWLTLIQNASQKVPIVNT